MGNTTKYSMEEIRGKYKLVEHKDIEAVYINDKDKKDDIKKYIEKCRKKCGKRIRLMSFRGGIPIYFFNWMYEIASNDINNNLFNKFKDDSIIGEYIKNEKFKNLRHDEYNAPILLDEKETGWYYKATQASAPSSIEPLVEALNIFCKEYSDKYSMDNIILVLKPRKNKENGDNEDMDINENIKNLLISNKQIILTGAPGTGKTYKAKEVSNDLIRDEISKDLKSCEDIRKNLVQFHPSFDYTDFIEGIRPILSKDETVESKTIGYELKNGVFKEFCRNAGVIERIIANKLDISDENIDKFLKTKYENKETIKFWKNFIKHDKIQPFIDEYNNEKNSKEKQEKQNEIINNLPKFIFIIDEINRAEISKVIGEIMYSIDPDYRGYEGRVKTQYSSSNNENTFFITKDGNDEFFIPSNVYIIGTMNNIDRSVEVFDFALRRRFAWKEIECEEVMEDVLKSKLKGIKFKDDNVYNLEDFAKRANDFNKKYIKDKINLGKSYYLGPSYFAKIGLYKDDDYESALGKLWNNHIQQIISEYTKNRNLTIKKAEFVKHFSEEKTDANDNTGK